MTSATTRNTLSVRGYPIVVLDMHLIVGCSRVELFDDLAPNNFFLKGKSLLRAVLGCCCGLSRSPFKVIITFCI